ncbi:MAG: CHASE domain-containing protein [Magnetococcales bacterium]|nr:CHASE domain-containing protein [Magnetococcales bacterium]
MTAAHPLPRVAKSIASILLLSIVYLLAGKAGLVLAIPPGYATAIFPASGVALAALLIWGWRLWPGVFLGSFSLNIWASLAATQQVFTFTTVAISAGIGIGAAIQSIFGAWLIRRFVGFPAPLDQQKEVFRFLIFGGASCLVSASVGIFTLWLSGVVYGANFIFSWWTWWVGDALGVLIGVPIILTFFGEPKPLWKARRWSVALPLVVLILGMIPIFIVTSNWESQRIISEFRKQAALLQQTLESKIQLNLDAIQTLKDYHHGVEKINFKGFTLFAQGILSRHGSLHALSFNPRILADERPVFEAKIQKEVDPTFTIKERKPTGGLTVALDRHEYVAVAYIQPLQANHNALGFDVASNPKRKIALDLARDTGNPIATKRINLIQERQSQAGVLVFLPIYSEKSTSIEERRKNLIGYGVGVFRVGDLFASALEGIKHSDISARLYDEESPTDKIFLAGYGGGKGLWEKENKLESGLGISGPWWSKTLDFGGRHWRMELSPTHADLKSKRSLGVWFVLVGGLFFASLLGAFQLIMTGRAARIEEMVSKRTKQLSDRESRLKAIFDSAGEGIITMNEHGIIESANPAATLLFGYNLDEITGQNVSMLIPSHFDGNQQLFVQQLFQKDEGHVERVNWEVEGVHKLGTMIPVDLSVSEVKLAEKRLFTGILHDLTERKRADKLKSEFISTVSHELRTPLTSIYGGLKIVLAGVTGELPVKAKKLLQLAYNNSERLNLLINDILDIQKMESGMMDFKFKPLNVSLLINRVVEDNASYAEKYGINYSIIEPIPEALAVNGDESRLSQVLANLLSNAAKFSNPEGTVEIRVEQLETWVQISITDHGKGIPEEFHPRVFHKFAQADSSDTRKKGGTGLGLSISKVLVESHKGEIGFISKSGQGTTFFVRLPILKSGL